MKKISIEIREYVASDNDSVVRFMEELQLYFSKLDKNKESKAFSSHEDAKAYVNQALKDVKEMDGVVFVAKKDGELRGFIQGVIVKHDHDVMHNLTHKKGFDGWIGLFFVDPKFRGNGIGKLLLNKIKVYFKSKNCQSMRLKVAHNNELAMNVYTHYGLSPRDVEMSMKI